MAVMRLLNGADNDRRPRAFNGQVLADGRIHAAHAVSGHLLGQLDVGLCRVKGSKESIQ
jgi:hypothetical protein